MKPLTNKAYGIIAFAILLLVAFLFIFSNTTRDEKKDVVPLPSAPALSLDPEMEAYEVAKPFTVNVLLATGENGIDGVDVILRYNPSLLRVEDSDPNTPGVQVQPGALMPVNPLNLVDIEKGAIRFSQLTEGGARFKASLPQILATLRFVPAAPGEAEILFDFTPGDTDDSNIASRGVDILTEVKNAKYTIN